MTPLATFLLCSSTQVPQQSDRGSDGKFVDKGAGQRRVGFKVTRPVGRRLCEDCQLTVRKPLKDAVGAGCLLDSSKNTRNDRE